MIYTYINKGITGVFEISKLLEKEHNTGTSVSDYFEGKWILLSDEQNDFRLAHPRASHVEIINMNSDEPPTMELEIAKETAIRRIDSSVKDKIEEIFPLREIVDRLVADRLEQGNATVEYLERYTQAVDRLMIEAEDSKLSVQNADNVLMVDTVAREFVTLNAEDRMRIGERIEDISPSDDSINLKNRG